MLRVLRVLKVLKVLEVRTAEAFLVQPEHPEHPEHTLDNTGPAFRYSIVTFSSLLIRAGARHHPFGDRAQ